MRLILTGTTGNLGSRVLTSLLSHNLLPPSSLIISTSNPNKVPPIAKSHNIETRQGDYTNPSSLVSSFSGADALFLVSFPSPSIERWLHHKAAIDAAREAGVKVVIYTSLMFGGESGMESVAEVQQAHIKTVKYLQQQQKAGGMDFIILREGIYAESWWLYAGFQDRSFKRLQADPSEITFVIPDDGPIAWVGWDDLGLGTAKILARYPYTEYRNTSLRLTGPRATALSSIARILSSQTGRKVSVNLVGVEEAKRYHKDVKKSVSEDEAWLVDSWVGWFEGIRNGEAALVDPLLGGLLGRDPKGIEEMVEEGGLFGVTD